MKKLIALVLTLALGLLCLSALAESPEVAESAEGTTESGIDATWIQITDAGFQILIPSEWYELEITEEEAAAGLFYAVCDEDITYGVNFYRLDASDEDYADLEAYAANLAQSQPGASVLPINGLNFVAYDNVAANTANLMYFCDNDIAYTLEFYPLDNEDFGTTYAQPIIMSISPIE